ncbi:MAG: aldehyde:ferredoxin oxidoreductase [Spirochaetes bacterium RIFOXYC1_FULL_54_7]|nr:MAG: aldehyde:ferredoxin oxidoreductase [Spirochaetes bacterium RIFOXYC1_FULL_54_7]
MHGFYGRFLVIDIGTRAQQIMETPEAVCATYLGGKGLGSWLLHSYNPPGVDPLSPDNVLILATGPLTGSPLLGSCRYGVYTKSPQTGFYSESYAGGKAPEAMDEAGFDAIVIKGQSSSPLALAISTEGAAFHDASELWGVDTHEAEKQALKRYAPCKPGYRKPGALVIGPAGEALVRFAVIENDLWRSAGRTGPGAVMGSKHIKAIVFQGDRTRPLDDAASLKAFAQVAARISKETQTFKNYRAMGTTQAEALHSRNDVKPNACAKCAMACGRLTTIRTGRHAGLQIEGPEFETIYAFGGLCMVDSIEEIAWLNDICDRLGMDTMSAGNLCAFTIEAVKAGKVDFAMDYNKVDAIAQLLGLIARREAVGAVLAEGIRHAAKQWGLEDLAVHVKGLEPAGYDPRTLKGMGLGYSVVDRGACHLRSTFYKAETSGLIDRNIVEGKAELFMDYEHRITLFDTLVLCRFYREFYLWDELATIIGTATGLPSDKVSLIRIAMNTADLIRLFNIREGLTPADDVLPARLYREKLEGDRGITEEELLYMRREYYALHGWDEAGRPKAGAPHLGLKARVLAEF